VVTKDSVAPPAPTATPGPGVLLNAQSVSLADADPTARIHVTTDGSPVVGSSRRHEGLFHAFGFCGHGFQLGPAAGAALVDLAVDGRCETDISGLGIGRFLGGAN